jgi:CRISPR-associated protein Cas4
MKVGIEIDERSVDKIFRTLNKYRGESLDLHELLVELLRKNVKSSDYLFLILSKLERENIVKGKAGRIDVLSRIDNKLRKKIVDEIKNEIKRHKRIVVTPLEVAKFYQCPRRIYLEKVVLSKQFKKERGKVWDGEVVHLAINMFIDNLMKLPIEQLLFEIPKVAIERYVGKTTLTKEKVAKFIEDFYSLVKDEKFNLLLTERTLESFKIGLVGTPDVIARKENGEFIPIDIKLGRLDRRRGVKKEHLLQSIGEALLIEDFFRINLSRSYLLYFQSNSVVKIKINKTLKREFLKFKRELERVCSKKVIPEKSRLPNAVNRVCKGCHVRHACENIEELTRFRL